MPRKASDLRPKRKGALRPAPPAGVAPIPATPEAAEHSAYLQALIDNNPLAIAVSDVNGRIQMCNPAFELLFGYHQHEILNADLDTLLAPAELSKEAKELTQRVRNGEVARAKTRRRRSDRSLVDVQI